MVATVLLLGLVLVAAITDLRRHKIYNWTTYGGILAALGLSGLRSLLEAVTDLDKERLGCLTQLPLSNSIGDSIGDSISGLLVCGFLMLVVFVMFRIGGGDVKLIAMLGAFLGWEQGLGAMLWTFVLGGCMGLIVLIWRVGPRRLLVRAWRQLVWTLRLGSWGPLSEDERAQLQPPLFLAPNALLAVVIVQLQLAGYLPR